ncbi:MAG TPA: aldehyde dehydrogenase family protein, partial [Promineifilum sp.]|nr:aldehyde dehydrogenase family protein [Promineifilum sp.]
MTQEQKFKVTYSTLSSPDPELHRRFEEAVAAFRANAGQTYPMYINGEERYTDQTFAKVSPADTSLTMAYFQKGTEQDANDAVAAAKAAYPGWRDTPWQERVAIMRRAADLLSERLFEIAAVMSLEVGKNRLESLGDVEETADLIRYNCDAMEANNGFSKPLKNESDKHHNRSVLKPYGVWVVIS